MRMTGAESQTFEFGSKSKANAGRATVKYR